MKFLLLTYTATRHGRVSCILTTSTEFEWSVMEEVIATVNSPRWAAMMELWASLCESAAQIPAVHCRVLALPSDEPMSGDGDAYWARGRAA